MLIYLNGCFLEAEDCGIPIDDRGFTLGDGIFETMRFHNQVIYRCEWHRERLQQSLNLMRLKCDASQIIAAAAELIAKAQKPEGLARVTVTRGAGGQGYLPSSDSRPTIAIVLKPLPEPVAMADLWVSNWRKPPLNALPVQAKITSAANSILARMEAADNACGEALQLSLDGFLAEGASSNIFWVTGGVLYTPSLDAPALNGIIRQVVIDKYNGEIVEGLFTLEALEKADEVFMTNVSWLLRPVRFIKGKDFTYGSFDSRIADEIKTLLLKDIEKECGILAHTLGRIR